MRFVNFETQELYYNINWQSYWKRHEAGNISVSVMKTLSTTFLGGKSC